MNSSVSGPIFLIFMYCQGRVAKRDKPLSRDRPLSPTKGEGPLGETLSPTINCAWNCTEWLRRIRISVHGLVLFLHHGVGVATEHALLLCLLWLSRIPLSFPSRAEVDIVPSQCISPNVQPQKSQRKRSHVKSDPRYNTYS